VQTLDYSAFKNVEFFRTRMKHEKYSCTRENPERAVFFLDKRSWYLRLFPEGGDRANLLFP
jgi:hypothetical protein